MARILITQDQIRARVRAMAAEIAAAYGDSPSALTIVPILAGSIIFLADLIRELPLRMKIALLHVSTYRGQTTPGMPRLLQEPTGDVAGRDVLLVDDILDSGRTLRFVQQLIDARGPRSRRTAVLLRKPAAAPADIQVDFVGFDIENEFVVGYGLDFDDLYRNFPHIGVLRAEITR